jgi:hypothetical protein
VQPLSDVELIRTLKARYFRYMDTKAWPEFRTLFADDLRFFADDQAVPTSTEPTVTSADEFVARVSAWLATAITVHHGHMGEIALDDSDHAHGVWAMFDWVDNPDYDRAFQGYGHYHERYVKGPDGKWRISELRLTRLRVEHVVPTSHAEVAAGRSRWLHRNGGARVPPPPPLSGSGSR